MTEEYPIQTVIGETGLMRYLIDLENPWIRLALPIKRWNIVIVQINWKEATKMVRGCAYDPDFTHNKLDAGFQGWITQELTAYCTFLNQGSLKSFQNVKVQYGLVKSAFLQISSSTALH